MKIQDKYRNLFLEINSKKEYQLRRLKRLNFG
jgi:hypothetical protein